MIAFHVAAAILALASGAGVVILEKGTSAHRSSGKVYVAALLALCFSGFFIYELTGGLTIFHALAIQGIALVSAGLFVPLFLREKLARWYVWHARFMLYSYISLVITGIAQFFDYLPFDSDALNAVVFIQIPGVSGILLVEALGMPRWREKLGPASSSGAGE